MPSAITRTSGVSYLAFGDVAELDKRLNELTAKYFPKHRRISSEYGYHYESLSNDMKENCSKVRKMQGDACGFEMKDNRFRKDVITSDYMETTALITERRRKLKDGISSRQQMEEISQKIADLSNVQEKINEISRKHKKALLSLGDAELARRLEKLLERNNLPKSESMYKYYQINDHTLPKKASKSNCDKAHSKKISLEFAASKLRNIKAVGCSFAPEGNSNVLQRESDEWLSKQSKHMNKLRKMCSISLWRKTILRQHFKFVQQFRKRRRSRRVECSLIPGSDISNDSF
uniref:uncharacterized protein LOC120342733 n=1 Tax=Styela clava TaxID=7725 RepID=UPI00193A32A1|nr:uncharacterized protein LOC120342733 [Styela clava]